MGRGLVFLRRTANGIHWEVSRDHQKWVVFPHTCGQAGCVIDEARIVFLSSMIALVGPEVH